MKTDEPFPMTLLTDEPFLIPMTLLTASCLIAVIHGCGGCVAAAGDLDRGETVSTSGAFGSETSDLSFDIGETETGEALDMPLQFPPEIPPASEACTTIVDGCCWCMPTGERCCWCMPTGEPACAVGLDAAECDDIGEMIPGCVLISFPPTGADGPLCQFQCV